MKTAVEWLADEIIMLEERLRQEEINLNDFMDLKDDLVTKALKMEESQRKEDFINGYKARAELSNLIYDEASELSAKELFKQQEQ
jgi:uncharacterized protein YihD (DUF1040 family)